MRFGLILFGIIVGAAGYFVGGIIGIVGIVLGILLFILGIFLKKKEKMQTQGGSRGGKPKFGPMEIPAISDSKVRKMSRKKFDAGEHPALS